MIFAPNRLQVFGNTSILASIELTRNASMMLKNVGISSSIVFLLFSSLTPSVAVGQTYGSAGHTVTVTVATINNIQVSSGTVNLAISGANAIAGLDQMTATDQSTSFLWGINSSLKKVTVSTNAVAQQFTLKVEAINPTQGTASPQVTLTTIANDFLINLGRSSGSCSIKYTGIALASQGTGTDSHTITFTIQTQ